jgi:hypothetical protein
VNDDSTQQSVLFLLLAGFIQRAAEPEQYLFTEGTGVENITPQGDFWPKDAPATTRVGNRAARSHLCMANY